MSDATSRLSLPYILPNQAQKHVTHNEALARLDTVVQLVVEAFGATVPPSGAADGACWALGAAPQGVWAGQDGRIAVAQAGAWVFVTPQTGWLAVGRTALDLRVWTGTDWDNHSAGDLDQVAGVGINTGYDTTNRLAVAAAASLLSHEGTGGHQLKINKAASTDTASLLFQTDWTGHAEMGIAGSDAFEVKVSADGSTWFTGLQVAPATGQLSAPHGIEVTGTLSGSAVMQSPTDATPDRVMTTGAFGLGSINMTAVADTDVTQIPTGSHSTAGITTGSLPPGNINGLLQHWSKDPLTAYQVWQSVLSNDVYHRRARVGIWSGWSKFYDTGNTTVDANGFVKAASPIVRLAHDGIEEPVEPVNARFERLDVGRYAVSDVNPLATSGWQIEVPQDHNGNRLVFVSTGYDARTRVLEVTTQAVVWDAATGLWAGGAPMDIPAGRWVDIRLSAPQQEGPYPDPDTDPDPQA